MKAIKLALMAVALCAGLISLPACRSLDPAGVYKGDKVLYNADQTITSAYDLVHLFVKWEYDNRASLPVEVSRAADAVRANAVKALKTATSARAVYASNPGSKDALDVLLTALDVVKSILPQIEQYIGKK